MTQVIILANEAESYVQSLKNIALEDIGSTMWLQQHEYLEKLNMQAILSATNQQDEFVQEFFVSHDKIKFLVYDAILTEVWKMKIFNRLLDKLQEDCVDFPFYFMLYHEVTIVSLLETLLFHKECCEAAEDLALDLTDYCYRKIMFLLNKDNPIYELSDLSNSKLLLTSSSNKDLQKQLSVIDFEIGIKSLSILRYLIDNLASLPLSVGTRMLNHLDIPLLLVEILEDKPWQKEHNEKSYVYLNSTWKINEMEQLPQCEVQIWLSLFQLILNEAKSKYEFNSFRKNILLKLRPRITNIVLDQIPVLVELQKFLDQLSIYEAPPVKGNLILDQIPEIWDSYNRRNDKVYQKIADEFLSIYLNSSNGSYKEYAKTLERIYNFDALESLLDEPARCACCGEQAVKRCSRCQHEWYCRRECQVKNWPKHKPICDMLFEAATISSNIS